MSDVIHLLATGPEDRLRAFQLRVCYLLVDHTRRDKTISYTCLADNLDYAIASARDSDVTLQRTIGFGESEKYPVLHLGMHGLKWERMKVAAHAREDCGAINAC